MFDSETLPAAGELNLRVNRRSLSPVVKVRDSPMSADSIVDAAKCWYGYGRWDAPFWFIGPEPGMKRKEGDNLLARCEAWRDLGSTELLDCVDHHRAFRHTIYHDRTMRMKKPVRDETMRPPTQDTWRQLIRLLLAVKGERTDNDAVGDFQCTEWGTVTGKTCVVELSALAANSFLVERDRTIFRRERCEHLRIRLLENTPRFVLMYGVGARDAHEQIVDGSFDMKGDVGYAWCGQSLCVLTPSPTSHLRYKPTPWAKPAWWIARGVEMQEMIITR